MKFVLISRPYSCIALIRVLCFGMTLSLPINNEAVTQPIFNDPASRNISSLFSALHLIDHLHSLLHPLFAFIAETHSLEGQHSVDADDPVARDAVYAKTVGVSPRRDDRERIIVLLHKRIDQSDLIVDVERQ